MALVPKRPLDLASKPASPVLKEAEGRKSNTVVAWILLLTDGDEVKIYAFLYVRSDLFSV